MSDATSRIVFCPTLVAAGNKDVDGRLVMLNDHLVAVLVRLDREEHGDLMGHWSLEATFGPAAPPPNQVFATLDDASVWVQQNLTRRGKP